MTKEYFNDNWHKECLKGGVLTIPDNLTELSGWEFHGCEDIRKVILPSYGIDIADEVFCDCVNLEKVENFPPMYHVDEEFIDEDTGEKNHFVKDCPYNVPSSVFEGCFNLFKDKQRIDEDGCVWLDIEGKLYFIGIPQNTPSFYDEICTFVMEKYLKSGITDKTAFSFQEKIERHGIEYEYVFENGALYNKTNGTWILYLSNFSNLHLVIPQWVKEYVHYEPHTSVEYTRFEIKSLHFLGATDLESILSWCKELECIEFSDKHTRIKSLTLCDAKNLVKAKFGNPQCILETSAFERCSNLVSLIGLEEYSIYGGAIFHQGHVVSVLSSEVHYPDGAEWLDNCWVSHVLYLPKSIKYIENNPNFKEDYDRGWEPTYLHVKTIVVPAGYKDYYINLFWENLQTYEGWFEDIKREELSKHIVEN